MNIDEVFDSLSLQMINSYKFKIKTTKSEFNLKWSQLKNITEETSTQLKDAKEDYTIKIVSKV